MNEDKTLILGLGNDILSDDAIGPKLVYRLKPDLTKMPISFLTASVGGMELLDLLHGFERVIIIDAIKTGNAVPGTVQHLTPDHFKETLHLSNFHDLSFLDALKFASKMDIDIPKQIDILAVEIVEDLNFSNEFSPQIASKYESIYSEVKRYVLGFLANN